MMEDLFLAILAMDSRLRPRMATLALRERFG